jgi:hypothetical protein
MVNGTNAGYTMTTQGSSTEVKTGFMFMKLADT